MALPFERPFCPNITKLSRNLMFWISKLPKSSIRFLLSCERLTTKALQANFYLFMQHILAVECWKDLEKRMQQRQTEGRQPSALFKSNDWRAVTSRAIMLTWYVWGQSSSTVTSCYTVLPNYFKRPQKFFEKGHTDCPLLLNNTCRCFRIFAKLVYVALRH